LNEFLWAIIALPLAVAAADVGVGRPSFAAFFRLRCSASVHDLAVLRGCGPGPTKGVFRRNTNGSPKARRDDLSELRG
jgi:hypothetical protein